MKKKREQESVGQKRHERCAAKAKTTPQPATQAATGRAPRPSSLAKKSEPAPKKLEKGMDGVLCGYARKCQQVFVQVLTEAAHLYFEKFPVWEGSAGRIMEHRQARIDEEIQETFND